MHGEVERIDPERREVVVNGKTLHGDHLIVVAEVVDAGVHRDGEPLVLRGTKMHYAG